MQRDEEGSAREGERGRETDLHDVARLLEALAHVLVELAEPAAELAVVLRVGVDLVDRVPDGLHRGAVGEALEEGAQLVRRLLEVVVVADRRGVAAALLAGLLGLDLVVLGAVEEEVDRLLVVLVALVLDDDLLEAVDEPVATLLGELVVEVVLRAVQRRGEEESARGREGRGGEDEEEEERRTLAFSFCSRARSLCSSGILARSLFLTSLPSCLAWPTPASLPAWARARPSSTWASLGCDDDEKPPCCAPAKPPCEVESVEPGWASSDAPDEPPVKYGGWPLPPETPVWPCWPYCCAALLAWLTASPAEPMWPVAGPAWDC